MKFLFPQILLTLLLAPYWAWSGIEEGRELSSTPVPNVRGKTIDLAEGPARLFVGFELSALNKSDKQVKNAGENLTGEHGRAVFLSHKSIYPSIIRGFAISQMKKCPHEMVVLETRDFLDQVPRQKGKITIVTVGENGRVTKLQFWDPGTPVP